MPFPTETTSARENLEAAGGHLDLIQAPFTLPRSRLIIFAQGEGLRVCTSEYEKRLSRVRGLREPPGARRRRPRPARHPGPAARDRVRRRRAHAELRRALGPEHRPGSRAGAGHATIHWQTPDGLTHSMSAGRIPRRLGAPCHRFRSPCRGNACGPACGPRGGDRIDLAGMVRQVPAGPRGPAGHGRLLLVGAGRQHRRDAGAGFRPRGGPLQDRLRRPVAVGCVLHRRGIAPRRPGAGPRTAVPGLRLPRNRRPAAGRGARARHPGHQRRPSGLRPRDPAPRGLRDRRPLGPGAADQAAAGRLGAAQGAGGGSRRGLGRGGLG